jgi:hypothetical protein
MTTKRTTILESFVTVGSFDCDHTQEGTFITKNAYPIPQKKMKYKKYEKSEHITNIDIDTNA